MSELSQHQRELIQLYKDAYGYAIVWKSKKKVVVLNPKEVSIIQRNELMDIVTNKKLGVV